MSRRACRNTLAQLELTAHRPQQAAAALARLQVLLDAYPDMRDTYEDLVEAEVLRSEVALQLHQPDRAAQAAERALALATRTFVPDVVGFVPALVALGQARLAQNRAADAVAPLKRALTLLERAQIPESGRSIARLPLSRALAAARQL